MKLSILLLCFSSNLWAQLIFENSFEGNGSIAETISGTVSGLNTTGLSLQLSHSATSETLNIASSGNFEFISHLLVGTTWNVSIASQPTTQNCTISNNSGIVQLGGVTDIIVACATDLLIWNQTNWNEKNWQ